ncbi:HTH-type transcriptional regulator AscG [Vibrio aerogenes CECT 7868]|uniref:HTH-type transcriptional regulator AscG n=1 Tax=Vibrio aerogenes CECT 7868 TaxID=1216006 RepID=A0A1M5VXI7_9VIBR|nr:LacI family DNA-binding transcriptional regulator [Vibrio aerogenes]SHH79890.1 HTH-type transcriptional regulator AscG [Vibrio aerogenes CECT 7868]
MATINDVCKAAGVSKATVSRVINHSGQVREETRQHVLSIMEQLGYQPNLLAQALATNTSNSIGLILPHFANNYFGSVLKKTAQILQLKHKKLFVMDSHDNMSGEIEALHSLAAQRCDAIIIYSRHLTETQLATAQQDLQIPLVVLNRCLEKELLFSFGFNQKQLAQIAVDHLLELGHRHIACIATPLTSQTGQQRLQAYKSCLNNRNIPVQEDLIVQGNSTLPSGYTAAMKLLEKNTSFTALFCCNDNMAIGAIRAFHDQNISVPKDISVIGIDNEPAACYAIPSLSTVSLPVEKLTEDAVNLAVSLSDKSTQDSHHYEYSGMLEARESTRTYPYPV